MVPRLLYVCICFAVAAIESVANGQDSTQPLPATAVTYATQADVNALRSDVQAINKKLEVLTEQIAALAGDKKPNATLEERVAILEAEHEFMLDTQRDHGAAIGQIAQRDGGKYHWRFDATSQPAVKEFKKAIAATAPQFGKLWVRNLTGSDQWIVINGKQERVLAGARDVFDVPVGTVETRVPGESTKAWFIGMPKYEYSIDIKSRPYTPVVTRVYEYPASIGWVAAY